MDPRAAGVRKIPFLIGLRGMVVVKTPQTHQAEHLVREDTHLHAGRPAGIEKWTLHGYLILAVGPPGSRP